MKTVMIYPVDDLLEGDIIHILEDFKGENLIQQFKIQNLKVEKGSSGISCCYFICDNEQNLNKLVSILDGKRFGSVQVIATLINSLIDDEIGITQYPEQYTIQEPDIDRDNYKYLPYYNAEGYSNSFEEKGGIKQGKSKTSTNNLTDFNGLTNEAMRVMKYQYDKAVEKEKLIIPQFTEVSVGPFSKEPNLFVSSSYSILEKETTNDKKTASSSLSSSKKEKERKSSSSSSKSKHRRHHHRHHKHHHKRHHRRKHSSSSSSPYSDSSESSSTSSTSSSDSS